jgi:hypothetical protein
MLTAAPSIDFSECRKKGEDAKDAAADLVISVLVASVFML